MLKLYLTGIALGIMAAIIPGPINLETIRRTIRLGPRYGASFGLGAVMADTLYVAMCSLGAMALLDALNPWAKALMYLVGGGALLYLAITALMADVPAPPPDFADDARTPLPDSPETGLWAAGQHLITGFMLTFFSPSTFGYWAVITFSANTLMMPSHRYVGPMALAAGVATACTLWIGLAISVSAQLYRRVKPKVILRIEQSLGVALLAFSGISFFEGFSIVARLLFFEK